jgi:type VI secretion system secreted protein VgrG
MSLTRFAVLHSPLGEKLQLISMVGHEELGRAFRYDLDLITTDLDIDFSSVLGKLMSVEVEVPDGSTREFTGYVTEFALTGGLGTSVHYRAVLRPSIELLSYRANCRIFQHVTVPDVVRQIFRDAGFTDFDDRLTETYRTWEYLVQYRESDFAFVSRLLEQEGIYYFFLHSGGNHRLVLCDSSSAHEAVAGYEKVPYYPPERQRRERDHINAWNLTRRIKPGRVATNDFDFTRPRATLLQQRSEPDEDAGAEYEDYDYPGEYVTSDEGSTEARVRLEVHHADRELAEGAGDAVGLAVGARFTLDKFPRSDQNKEYLVVRATYQIRVNADQSGIGPAGLEGLAGPPFHCQFAAIDATRAFRTTRSKRKPVVEGPQTAIVVGPAGEEIFTDEYGRVKVKFHWDRLSKADENSSCWVRVAQLWAGTSFGGIHIPRVGQEVIVDFLEGDPDRPIITGRVYNSDNQPPYALPANQSQSGIKSHSTKGGTLDNFNELRFEDKFGNEQVYLQAEKDLAVLVKNIERRDVKASRTSDIGTDDTLHVGQNRLSTVFIEDREIVGASQWVEVGANQTISVTATRKITSATELVNTGTRTKTVSKDETTKIGGERHETVEGPEKVTIGGHQTIKVNAGHPDAADIVQTLSVYGARQQSMTTNDELHVGDNLTVSVGKQIVFTCGESSLTLTKEGDVVLAGKNMHFQAKDKVNIRAKGDVIVKGDKVGMN